MWAFAKLAAVLCASSATFASHLGPALRESLNSAFQGERAVFQRNLTRFVACLAGEGVVQVASAAALLRALLARARQAQQEGRHEDADAFVATCLPALPWLAATDRDAVVSLWGEAEAVGASRPPPASSPLDAVVADASGEAATGSVGGDTVPSLLRHVASFHAAGWPVGSIIVPVGDVEGRVMVSAPVVEEEEEEGDPGGEADAAGAAAQTAMPFTLFEGEAVATATDLLPGSLHRRARRAAAPLPLDSFFPVQAFPIRSRGGDSSESYSGEAFQAAHRALLVGLAADDVESMWPLSKKLVPRLAHAPLPEGTDRAAVVVQALLALLMCPRAGARCDLGYVEVCLLGVIKLQRQTLHAAPALLRHVHKGVYLRSGRVADAPAWAALRWLATHVSTFELQWPWVKWESGASGPALSPRRRACNALLSRVGDLVPRGSVVAKLPEPFVDCLPPLPLPRHPFTSSLAGATQREGGGGADAEASEKGAAGSEERVEWAGVPMGAQERGLFLGVVDRVQGRESGADMLAWLRAQGMSTMRDRMGAPGAEAEAEGEGNGAAGAETWTNEAHAAAAAAVVSALLHVGARSFSHTERAVRRYGACLRAMVSLQRAEERGRGAARAIADAVAACWRGTPTMATRALMVLVEEEVVPAVAAVEAMGRVPFEESDGPVAAEAAAERVRVQGARDAFDARVHAHARGSGGAGEGVVEGVVEEDDDDNEDSGADGPELGPSHTEAGMPLAVFASGQTREALQELVAFAARRPDLVWRETARFHKSAGSDAAAVEAGDGSLPTPEGGAVSGEAEAPSGAADLKGVDAVLKQAQRRVQEDYLRMYTRGRCAWGHPMATPRAADEARALVVEAVGAAARALGRGMAVAERVLRSAGAVEATLGSGLLPAAASEEEAVVAWHAARDHLWAVVRDLEEAAGARGIADAMDEGRAAAGDAPCTRAALQAAADFAAQCE